MAEYDYKTRSIIVNYRFRELYTYDQIASKIPGVTARGARGVCDRAKTRANSNNVGTILQHIEDKPREGAPRRVEPGSQTSKRIRQACRSIYKWHNQKEAANRVYKRDRDPKGRKPLEELAAQQVHNILQGPAHCKGDSIDSRPVNRKRALLKHHLTDGHLSERKVYIDKILQYKPAEVLLICVDETPVDFGGSIGHQRVNAPQGVVIYTSEHDPRFQKMQWSAACSDIRTRRPFKVWTPESDELTIELATKLHESNRHSHEEVDRQRAASEHIGTPEHDLIAKAQATRDIENQFRRENGQKALPFVVKPEHIFKYETFVRDRKKGGLDYVYYGFEIYEKVLFPYYSKIKASNPSMTVLISEDNVALHHKARRLMAPLINQLAIQFIDLPARSSDLHPIEHLFKDYKKLLADYRFAVRSAAKAVQQQAEQEMEAVWCDSHEFDELVVYKASLEAYQALAQRAKHAEPRYSNYYNDSIDIDEIKKAKGL
jgi:hypothetical protein